MARRSIRFRITAMATAVVAMVLIIAGLALAILHRSALTSTIDESLEGRADDIVSLLDAGALPRELASGGREGFALVVDFGGEIIAATPNLEGHGSLDLPGLTDERQVIRNIGGLPVDDDVFRVLSRSLPSVGSLHVATTFEIVSESTSALLASLALTIPIVVVAMGAVIWWLVGKTLRPVEDIRREVAGISATDLHRRVPQPRSSDEIDRLASTMNEMLVRLEESSIRQRRFVADASHELRTPLTRLRSEIEVERGVSADADQQRLLSSLHDEVVGMQAMVEDLLYIASADSRALTLEGIPVDLDDIVLVEARSIENRRSLAVDVSGVSAALVVGDRGQLTRAVRNLLENAVRHAGGRVTISLREIDGWATLTVADDGPGVAPDEGDKIFERFWRGDEARSSKTGGTGLGLAITREIVERHDGSVSLIVADGPGATFQMRIPVAE